VSCVEVEVASSATSLVWCVALDVVGASSVQIVELCGEPVGESSAMIEVNYGRFGMVGASSALKQVGGATGRKM
jgi:hypothetical protein